jgi:hypothetical protein
MSGVGLLQGPATGAGQVQRLAWPARRRPGRPGRPRPCRQRRRAAFVGRAGAPSASRWSSCAAGRPRFAEHDALAQRAALVRAAVEQREHAVVGGAEQRHAAGPGAGHAARAQHRDVVDAADGGPGVMRWSCRRGVSEGQRVGSAGIEAGLSPSLAPSEGGSNCRRSTAPCRTRTRGRARRPALNCSRSHSALRPSASSRMRFFTWSSPTRLHVVHRALQVPAFLAVQLQEGAGVLQHLLGGLQLAQKNCATSVLMPPLPAT